MSWMMFKLTDKVWTKCHFLFKSPQQFQMKPNVSCWRTKAHEFSCGRKKKEKGKKNMPWVWYYTLIELSLSSGWGSNEGARWDPPHASFTYVLTATTSPITHFWGKRRRSEVNVWISMSLSKWYLNDVCSISTLKSSLRFSFKSFMQKRLKSK